MVSAMLPQSVGIWGKTERKTKRADEGAGWWGEGVRAEEQHKTDHTKQSKEEKDYFQLVPALMSCCHSSLLSHHAVRAELPSSLRIIKWRERKRKRDGHYIDTKSSRHTFALQNEGKREWKMDSEERSEEFRITPTSPRSPQNANQGNSGRVVHSK